MTGLLDTEAEERTATRHKLSVVAPKAGKTLDCGFSSQEAFVIFADPHLPAVVGLLLTVTSP